MRSGQASLVQIANPYADEAGVAAHDDEQRAIALDRWVEQIQARFGRQHASWTVTRLALAA